MPLLAYVYWCCVSSVLSWQLCADAHTGCARTWRLYCHFPTRLPQWLQSWVQLWRSCQFCNGRLAAIGALEGFRCSLRAAKSPASLYVLVCRLDYCQAPDASDAYAARGRNPVLSYKMLLLAAMSRLQNEGIDCLDPLTRREVVKGFAKLIRRHRFELETWRKAGVPLAAVRTVTLTHAPNDTSLVTPVASFGGAL